MKLFSPKTFSLSELDEIIDHLAPYHYYFCKVNTVHWLLSYWGENTFNFLSQYHPDLIKLYFTIFKFPIRNIILLMPINPYFNLSRSVVEYIFQNSLDCNNTSETSIIDNILITQYACNYSQKIINYNLISLLTAHRIYLPDYLLQIINRRLFQNNRFVICEYEN